MKEQPDYLLINSKYEKRFKEEYWLLMQPWYIYYPVAYWRFIKYKIAEIKKGLK